MHRGQYADAKTFVEGALKSGETVEVIYNNDGVTTHFTVLSVQTAVMYK